MIAASHDGSCLDYCSVTKRTGGQTKRTVQGSGQLADVGIPSSLLRVETRLQRCNFSSDFGACT